MITEHKKAASGYSKKYVCHICGETFFNVNIGFIGNHVQSHNPERQYKNLEIARSNIRKRSNGAIKAKEEGRAWVSPNIGKKTNLGRKHTEEQKEKIRQSMLNSPHRRMSRATRLYTTTTGEIIKLDSYWEEILAKRLDSINVKWIRPKNPIRWFDLNNIGHNYFPDFYLEEYDIYLDPKNSYALRLQSEKIQILTKLMPNLVILTKEEDCRNYSPLLYR